VGEWISIGLSVGKRGRNVEPDVSKIGAALVAVGPDNGGIFGVPLSVDGLGGAIESFQRFQKLPSHDGKVDPTGDTLKRINKILNPGMVPPVPAPATARSGKVRRMATPPTATTIGKTTWAPVEDSLIRDHVFKWTGVAGKGRIEYFELDADVVPNWFGVVVPDGVTATEHIHIFFHPTTSQAGFNDQNYRSKAGWGGIFHYMTDDFSAQFCAASTGQILIMPVLNQGAAGTCGIFPAQWESICGQILALVAAGPDVETADPAKISSVVVSSFSAGITYSNAFRKAAHLGGRLTGIIDFDGIISSYSALSAGLPVGGGFPVVRFFQSSDATERQLPVLASQNFFPLARARWGEPWDTVLPKNPALAVKPLHGNIPQRFMFLAAQRTRPK
jgi:hypothetical protein